MNNDVMFNIGYGLYVLTARENEKDNGCIINTLMQVTTTPNKISVTVNKNNLTCEMIKNTKQFNVSILTEKTDFEVFERFGFHTGREVEKFKNFDKCKRSKNEIYYIEEYTNSYISANVIDMVDLGTHIMFIADVIEAEILSKDKSLTYDYYQENIKPKKQVEKGKYVCKICGYVYEGDELPEDFVCPWCKHGVNDFEKVN